MMESQTIRIQYLDDSIQRLTYVGGKSDWIDLAAAETVTLKAGVRGAYRPAQFHVQELRHPAGEFGGRGRFELLRRE